MLVSGVTSAEKRLFMPPKRANRFWKYLRNFRKRQNGENGVCRTSASIKMEEMALAELPQASKWRKWRLRNFRKHQNGENGPCGASASVKMGKMAFAGLPQASKWGKWPLRNFRKHQNGENGLCGTSASISKSDLPPFDVRFLAIAWGSTKKQGLRYRIASPA